MPPCGWSSPASLLDGLAVHSAQGGTDADRLEQKGTPLDGLERSASTGGAALSWRHPQPFAAIRSAPVPVDIRHHERHSWTVLSIAGELDVVGAPELRQAVVSAVAGGVRRLILDLSQVDFLDSFGIGVVVGALKRLRQRGGDLEVVCPVPRIRRVFEICDLDRVMALHRSVDRAARVDPAASAQALAPEAR